MTNTGEANDEAVRRIARLLERWLKTLESGADWLAACSDSVDRDRRSCAEDAERQWRGGIVMRYPILTIFAIPGLWWFRVLGYGIACKNTRMHRLLFSERNGLSGFCVAGLIFHMLTP